MSLVASILSDSKGAPPAMGNARSVPCVDVCKDIYLDLEKKKMIIRDGSKVKEEYLEAGRPYIGYKNGLYGKQGEFYLLSQECFYFKKERIRYTVCPYKESMQESEGNSFLIGEGGSWITDPQTGDDILVMNGGERSRCPQGKKRRTMV
ncbi:putative glucosidase 2 subunit beta isoform X1 [Apostichopus japonicus]|uniref:Putative glucosidase 2 subunit beta isoform X1 n=1 Tax=Stichopus japonicus TaxID=307972 RepID=A0A2G8JQS4_STIJA|nr:putative glucosidase 2 subunit beta isoform X1 [Apostichopus japonicus]